MCRRQARGDFRRCAHSGGCRGGLDVVASRPRSAAPAKITPSPPPPGLRVSACIVPAESGSKKRRLGAAGALRMVANQLSMFREACVVRAYAGHPGAQSPTFCWGPMTGERRSLQGRDGRMTRRRARRASRRCRGARAACPKTDTSLRDRPSEHSVEKIFEPDDPPRIHGKG